MGGFPTHAIGRAKVNARDPRAFAICDRCGFRYNHIDLSWQMEWAGNSLTNRRILVCERCLDEPNEQLRSYAPPADPVPIRDPRPELANEGNLPLVLVTGMGVSPVWLVDGLGNFIFDSQGRLIPINNPTYQVLLPADAKRTAVWFTVPVAFGIWINHNGQVMRDSAGNMLLDSAGNPLGGDSGLPWYPLPGATFYPPGSLYEAFGDAAVPSINIFSTVPNLTIVVQTEGGKGPPQQIALIDETGRPIADETGTALGAPW